MHESFIDLDELILLCRDKLAKKFIQEAVACYRAGAYRSCIVSTWNAVVFDFLHKLRELELLGDKSAAEMLQRFEKISSEEKVKELWQFESDIPNNALTKFELISPIERSDIERLHKDRSRCAHPSMTSLEEPFEATAELARYHLRSAVTHLLQRPPVQGRAACERIFRDIKSENFPVEPELAIRFFQKGPLARARFSLIKTVVIGLTKSLLIEELPEDERLRQFSALNAIASIYPKETKEILDDKLSEIILHRVTDENWGKTIIYLGSVFTWENISEPCRLKAITFIKNLDLFEINIIFNKQLSQENIDILLKALRIDFLKEVAIEKLQIPLADLLSIKNVYKHEIPDEIIVPLLRDRIPQASLDELISMFLERNNQLNQEIEPYLAERIIELSASSLFKIRLKYRDDLLNQLLDSILQEKISAATLHELILIKINSKPVFDSDADQEGLNNIIQLIEGSIIDQVEKLIKSSVVDRVQEFLLDEIILIKSECDDDLFNKLFQPFLRDNTANIVSRFTLSSSFDRAASNAQLLLEVIEFLNLEQWNHVLKAFRENDQIYRSNRCLRVFLALVEKSVELNGSLQPYWLFFRKEIDQFNGDGIKRLKLLIDSYQRIE